MKKRILYILSAVSIAFTSCNMDRLSPDSVPYEKAFESLGNVVALEGGLYSRLRTAYSADAIIAPDIQADYLNPINGFSNTHGNLYNWTYTVDETELSGVWQDFYAVIGHANFIIDGIENNLGFEVTPGSEEKRVLNRIQGVAHLSRALAYSVLAERFCADYDAETCDAEFSGLPLAIHYNPSVVPSRSTLAQVYEQINKDLSVARKNLKGLRGSQNSDSFNIDCVDFLEARILLQTDQYAKAYTKAMSFINNNKSYSLVSSAEELSRAWTYDKSSETLFQFYASKTEFVYSYGQYFCLEYSNGTKPEWIMMPDFIPSKSCVDKYDEKDWRRKVYFLDCSSFMPNEEGRIVLPLIKGLGLVAAELTIINKYPGNPDLRTSSAWNYVNTFKVFRLAELYLIAAEAGIMSEKGASSPLNALRKARGLDALDEVTMQDVKDERYREMMLEGTRLTDIKRWKDDLQRGAPQTGLVINEDQQPVKGDLATLLNSDLKISKSDYRLVWPIPSSEIFANPDFATQQNPGWKR